jgi:hypothetical protein
MLNCWKTLTCNLSTIVWNYDFVESIGEELIRFFKLEGSMSLTLGIKHNVEDSSGCP